MGVNLEIDVKSNRRAANQISKMYMQDPVYVACEDLNFDWKQHEVIIFDALWRHGISVEDIAIELNRDSDEVGILALDRARKGKIQKRANGVFGKDGECM